MRGAVTTCTLLVLAGTTAAGPRGRFAAYLDPVLVARKPPAPPPLELAVVIVCAGSQTSAAYVARARHQLVRAFGRKKIDPIAMHAIADCASGNDPVPEGFVLSCEQSLVEITPRNGEVLVDLRCTGDVVSAFRRGIASRPEAAAFGVRSTP